MPDYRLYLIGSAGHVERVEEIEARDDEEAIAASSTGRDGTRRALWRGPCLIGEWNCTRSSQGAP
ncbi:MAG: hypothetical protein V4696_11720 [Pseudomonadota bacterium]